MKRIVIVLGLAVAAFAGFVAYRVAMSPPLFAQSQEVPSVVGPAPSPQYAAAGLMPSEYPLPGDRATFYVPGSEDKDPRRGRRLMSMRDLACCANGMAFYSTPSDLVRFAMATKSGDVSGELAGGMVMSLMRRRDSGIVVAVTSNMAYANTSALAQRVGGVFAE